MESYKFKVVLLGEGRVGKTSIILRYVENSFSESQLSTIQASFLEKRINLGSCSVQLNIWDTAGQERFHALAPIYYREADGAVLVYDITDMTSFTKVQSWVEELRRIVGDDILLMIAANKQDLASKRQVEESKARTYAASVNGQLVGTSAKSGTGVDECFLALTKRLLEQARSKKAESGGDGYGGPRSRIKIVDDDSDSHSKSASKKGCCSLL